MSEENTCTPHCDEHRKDCAQRITRLSAELEAAKFNIVNLSSMNADYAKRERELLARAEAAEREEDGYRALLGLAKTFRDSLGPGGSMSVESHRFTLAYPGDCEACQEVCLSRPPLIFAPGAAWTVADDGRRHWAPPGAERGACGKALGRS